MKKILAVIGARPQFIKHAPMELALQDLVQIETVHTGQHYDANMSAIFFHELKMKEPRYLLQVGSANHGKQTGQMMIELEEVMLHEKPDAVLVYGDTNSTLAGALVAAKLHIPVIHIEAGLRSFNREMPEEINRVLTDHISNLLFAPTPTAIKNLAQEGIRQHVHLSGDVMGDMVQIARKIIKRPNVDQPYYFVTVHRPYNTDNPERLLSLLNTLNSLEHLVIFAMHPRTRQKLLAHGTDFAAWDNIQIIDPLSYFDSISYQAFSEAIITDSGGVQKEAYLLKKKCVTIRPETEWIETLEHGWNTLVFQDLSVLPRVLALHPGEYFPDLYGTGSAAKEIAATLLAFFHSA